MNKYGTQKFYKKIPKALVNHYKEVREILPENIFNEAIESMNKKLSSGKVEIGKFINYKVDESDNENN